MDSKEIKLKGLHKRIKKLKRIELMLTLFLLILLLVPLLFAFYQ